MQPHTLSCSCAGHPVIKFNRSMRQWTKKCLLPGTIIVTGSKCTRLCHADNHPSAARNHGPTWWWVSGGQRAIGLPSMSYTRPVRGPIWSWCSSVTRVTRSLWSPPPPCICGTCRPNLKAVSQWQGLGATGGHTARTGHYCRTLQRELLAVLLPFSARSPMARGASHARWAFLQTLYIPTGGQRPR